MSGAGGVIKVGWLHSEVGTVFNKKFERRYATVWPVTICTDFIIQITSHVAVPRITRAMSTQNSSFSIQKLSFGTLDVLGRLRLC